MSTKGSRLKSGLFKLTRKRKIDTIRVQMQVKYRRAGDRNEGQRMLKLTHLIKAKDTSGNSTHALLVDSIKGNGVALNYLFGTLALPLADFLVRSNEKAARIFGGELYEELFFESLIAYGDLTINI